MITIKEISQYMLCKLKNLVTIKQIKLIKAVRSISVLCDNLKEIKVTK